LNRELPKPLQEALARAGRAEAGEAHPSANVLAAFAEHGLPQDESQRVTAHLAQCGDCRDVVFLASSAVEEPVEKQQERVPAVAASQTRPPAFTAVFGAGRAPGAASEARRSRWRLWWVWAPAAAAVLLVSGVVLHKRATLGQPEYATMAEKAPLPALTDAQRSPVAAPAKEVEKPLVLKESAPPASKPIAKSARVATEGKPVAKGLHTGMTTLPAHEEYPSAPTVPPATQKAGPPPTAVLGGVVKVAPAVPSQDSFVESEGQTAAALVVRPLQKMEKPQMVRSFAPAPPPPWRVTPDGHLEHLTVPAGWTFVLADQPTTFHVVSVVGNNVWAGGNRGALFHSSDGGQNWSKQPLAGETGTIVSIQFSDAAHGVVTTDGGARWSTADGGASWTRG